jgi:hypothetical protein
MIYYKIMSFMYGRLYAGLATISVLSFLSMVLLPVVFGQQNLLTYTDPQNKSTIQYPSNWIINETQHGQIYTVFDSQEANAKNFYIVSFRLGIDNTPSSLDLNQYLQNSIKGYESTPTFQNFQVVESGINYNLAGKPAYKLVGTYTNSQSGIKRTLIETGTVVGSSIYYIEVLVDADQYFNYLPIINNMIGSYQINNATNNTSSTSSTPSSVVYPTSNNTLATAGTITPSGQNGFNIYQNSNMNIKLTYPNNWNISEFNNTFIIYPIKTDNVLSRIKPIFSVTAIDSSMFGSLDNALLSFLHYQATNKTNFNPIETTSTTVSKNNINARMAIYTYDDNKYGKTKEMSVFTTSGNNVYKFSYVTDEYNYPIYLPIILNMLNSLEFPNSTNNSNMIQGQNTKLPLGSTSID